MFNVYVYTPYEGEGHVLCNATDTELKAFLLKYQGYLDDLTIIEGKVSDTDAVLSCLGLVRYLGKAKQC